MVLLITDSLDEHSDAIALLSEGQSSFFRFNVDFALHYTFLFEGFYWEISDPYRSINSEQVTHVFVRKPFQSLGHNFQLPDEAPIQADRDWAIAQLRVIILELISFEKYRGHLKLLQYPFLEQDCKALQMHLAQKYFKTPKWKYFWQATPYEVVGQQCIKPIAQKLLHDNRFLFTTTVTDQVLSAYTPWFLQDIVEAEKDLTIVYINKKCFGFVLDRTQFEGLDWRSSIFEKEQKWLAYTLPTELETKCVALMQELKMDYGRFDFLIDKQDELHFLEVNPNGEWGWLDSYADNGIFATFMKELDLEILHNPFVSSKK